MTRAEHLQWCKDRALEYVDRGDTRNALASMFSDLGKHPETRGHAGIELGMRLLIAQLLNEPAKVREFINGIN